MNRLWAVRMAAMTGFLGVGSGAFGAHGLKEVLARHDTEAIWETAVFYHLIHAVMLWVLARDTRLPRGPWFCFLAGIVVFSGSLYLLAVTNLRWLGAITPIGGVSLLAGWVWLVVAASEPRPKT